MTSSRCWKKLFALGMNMSDTRSTKLTTVLSHRQERDRENPLPRRELRKWHVCGIRPDKTSRLSRVSYTVLERAVPFPPGISLPFRNHVAVCRQTKVNSRLFCRTPMSASRASRSLQRRSCSRNFYTYLLLRSAFSF